MLTNFLKICFLLTIVFWNTFLSRDPNSFTKILFLSALKISDPKYVNLPSILDPKFFSVLKISDPKYVHLSYISDPKYVHDHPCHKSQRVPSLGTSSAEKRQACIHPDSVKTRQQAIDQDISFSRTHRFLGAWEQITNDSEIFKVIEGYAIKFQQIPFQMSPPSVLKNLSEGEVPVIDNEIVDLLKKGSIEVCSHTPGESVSNIFTIPKKSGGNRPVIDIRVLNEFVKYIPFRMEDVSLLKYVLKQGDFMTKLDLKDAYLTVLLDKKLTIYLRFVWRGVQYQFTCLPFSFSSSGRIFTKAMKPVIAFLRAMLMRLLSFPDDILIMAGSHKLAMQHRLGNPGPNLLGVCDKLPNVHSHPFTGVAIPCWFHGSSFKGFSIVFPAP